MNKLYYNFIQLKNRTVKLKVKHLVISQNKKNLFCEKEPNFEKNPLDIAKIHNLVSSSEASKLYKLGKKWQSSTHKNKLKAMKIIKLTTNNKNQGGLQRNK